MGDSILMRQLRRLPDKDRLISGDIQNHQTGPSGACLATPAPTKTGTASAKPALLPGGNPQIAKGDGDAPVQAYIAAMPGWKSDVGRRLDTLIIRTLPGVRKAVKWNSPLYGMDGQPWFLGVHCFAQYIKLAFFRGTSLTPFRRSIPRTRRRGIFIFMRGRCWIKRSWPLSEAGERVAGERM